jgi:hypothetical protein
MHSGSRRLGELAGLFRRLAVLAALATFLATTIGVPLPFAGVKDRSQPFACMDRACGCMNAAQCWKGCCCFTDREKLAWCAAHGVEPPVALIAAVEHSSAHDPSASQCCDHDSGDLHEESSCATAQVSCATARGTEVLGFSSVSPAPGGPARIAPAKMVGVKRLPPWQSRSLVVVSAWRQCHGLAPAWSILGAVSPPPEHVGWHFEWTEIGRVCPVSRATSSVAFPPPLPPPRA